MAIKIVLITLLSYCSFAEAHSWKRLGNGLFYTHLEGAHVFHIDPKKLQISIAISQDLKMQNTTVKEIAQKTKTWLAINGGFFSPNSRSLGLLVRNGKILNALHPTSWWGVFYIENRIPYIVSPQTFKMSDKIEMAMQVGPRLVVNGHILKFKPALARRSGIGIRSDGTVMLVIVPMTEISMKDFAQLFQLPEKEGGLGCKDALNLDGGSSSQIYFHTKDFMLDIPGIKWVTNAITVKPR